jgi:hypothetical protein
MRALPNVEALIDMDGLKHWFRNEQAEMGGHIDHCRRIIHDHREQYQRLINSFQGSNSEACNGG